VYATIPLSDRQVAFSKRIAATTPERLVLAARFPQDPAVESLRMLRSALQFAMLEARNNVVMLAGPLPGIGKSFLSVNLATVLAAGGKRVLLVDGDLRKGHLNQYLGLARTAGFANVLDGSRPLHTTIQRNVLPNLDFLGVGEYPPNPAELLLDNRFREVMQLTSRNYDIVLLDAPAILAVSDTGIMAPCAGSIFLIARFEDTRTGEVVEASRRLAQTGARVNGVLLNGFKGHGGNYGHARMYGSHAYVAHHYESNTNVPSTK
jgi:tyrosine-protein kinase Etk/Wzc